MNNKWKLLLAIVLLVPVVWWIAEDDAPELEKLSANPPEIDYYLRDMRSVTYNQNGKPIRQVETPHLEHFTKDDTSELETPFISLYSDDTPPWEIQSEIGVVSEGGDLLTLIDQVEMDRAAAEGVRPYHLRTELMRFWPKKHYAESNEHVRLNSQQSRVTSVGMQAWLEDPVKIKLLSEAKGHYVPPE